MKTLRCLLLLPLALAACFKDPPPVIIARTEQAAPAPNVVKVAFRTVIPKAVEEETPPVNDLEIRGVKPRPPAVPLLPASSPESDAQPTVILATSEGRPSADLLTSDGRALIIEFEVGGRSGYNPHPEWPAGASGVTIGVGYDLRFNGKAVIASDWAALPKRDLERLLAAQGLSGSAASAKARELRDITIPWEVAIAVFERVTVAKFDALSRRTYPGYDALRGHARDSLISLTFNRGSSLVGARRVQMAEIARLSPKRDYEGMADQEEDMIPIWRGTEIYGGMKRRRLAEAAIMRRP